MQLKKKGRNDMCDNYSNFDSTVVGPRLSEGVISHESYKFIQEKINQSPSIILDSTGEYSELATKFSMPVVTTILEIQHCQDLNKGCVVDLSLASEDVSSEIKRLFGGSLMNKD